MSFTRVSKSHPCPVCKKPDWCRMFGDGWVECMRVPSDTPAKSGGWMWQCHLPLGGPRTVPVRSTPSHQPATINATKLIRDWRAATTPAALAEFAAELGVSKPSLVAVGAAWADGNTFIVDEHAARMWLPQRHAEAIKAMIGRHRMNGMVAMRGQPRLSWRSTDMYEPRPLMLSDLQRVVAGADVFSRQSDGSTIAGQYAKHGINLRPATTDRVNGWAEVMQGFGEVAAPPAIVPTGSAPGNRAADPVRPTLFIHERCKRLIETLPALQHDPNRPEDVLKVDADEDGNGGDDAADALRYLVATKGREVVVRKLTGW